MTARADLHATLSPATKLLYGSCSHVHVYILPFLIYKSDLTFLTSQGENECITMEAVPPNLPVSQRKVKEYLCKERHTKNHLFSPFSSSSPLFFVSLSSLATF